MSNWNAQRLYNVAGDAVGLNIDGSGNINIVGTLTGITNDIGIDDSTPIDINLTNASVAVTGTVAVSSVAGTVTVSHSGDIGIDDSTPIEVNHTADIGIDDSTPIDINVTNSTPIPVSATDELNEISRENVSGSMVVRKSGINSDIDGSGYEGVGEGSAPFNYLSSAEYVKAVSDDSDDTNSAGTGARQVQIIGLDGSYNLVMETVNLAGTTAVATTTNQFLRVCTVRVISAGSQGTNGGTISITNNAGTTTLLTIEPGEGQGEDARLTVPAGKDFYLTSLDGTESANKPVRVAIFVRYFGEDVFQRQEAFVLNQGGFDRVFHPRLKYPEKTDIEVRAKGETGVTNAIVAAGITGWIENNT